MKTIRAWAIVDEKGKLKETGLLEGCPNCDNTANGYAISQKKSELEFFKSGFLKEKIVRITITYKKEE